MVESIAHFVDMKPSPRVQNCSQTPPIEFPGMSDENILIS